MRVASLILAALLLAACSSNDPTSAGDGPGSGPSATASSAGTQKIDPSVAAQAQQLSDLQSLAAAAQSAASDLNANPPLDGPVLGGDISWPQCPAGMGIPFKESSGQPMPRDDAEFVIIGLTNGPGFHVNPCLADQVAYAREHQLRVAAYSVISWPDDATQAQYGGLQEAGRAQAEFNLQSMRAAGLDSPIIWLDIESVPHYDWSGDVNANAQVVLGAAQGYADAGYRIGVYSTPAIWAGIVGDLSLGVPEWRAAGQTSQEEALSRCNSDWLIQGGIGAIAQWVEDGRDRNITCPVTDRLGDYFTELR